MSTAAPVNVRMMCDYLDCESSLAVVCRSWHSEVEHVLKDQLANPPKEIQHVVAKVVESSDSANVFKKYQILYQVIGRQLEKLNASLAANMKAFFKGRISMQRCVTLYVISDHLHPLPHVWKRLLNTSQLMMFPEIHDPVQISHVLSDPRNAQIFERVISVNLSGLKLKRIPVELGCLRDVREIDLSDNCLQDLTLLERFPQLTTLHLQQNEFPKAELATIARAVANLPRIRNVITAEPFAALMVPEMQNTHALRKMWAKISEQVEDFASLSQRSQICTAFASKFARTYLLQIRELDLKRQHLHVMPSQIEHLSRLKGLDVSENNIEDLPETFGRLQKLEFLNLEANPLRADCYPKLARMFCSMPSLNLVVFKPHELLPPKLTGTVVTSHACSTVCILM